MYKEKKNNGHEKYINKTFNIKKKKKPKFSHSYRWMYFKKVDPFFFFSRKKTNVTVLCFILITVKPPSLWE